LSCASIICLERLHVWEESYLYSDFELEKRNRPSYREKHCFLGGWPITCWVVLMKGLGSIPWISITKDFFWAFHLWRGFSPAWSLFLVLLFALWSYLLALSWWWTQNNNDDDELTFITRIVNITGENIIK